MEKCKNKNWIQVINILLINASETSNKWANVFNENPLLSLRRVINSSSLGENCRVGPGFAFLVFLDSLGFVVQS